MGLSKERQQLARAQVRALTDDGLLKLKSVSFDGLRDVETGQIDSDLLAEQEDIERIISEEWRRRNN